MSSDSFMPRSPWRKMHAVKAGFRAPDDSLERLLAEMLLACQEERAELEKALGEAKRLAPQIHSYAFGQNRQADKLLKELLGLPPL